MTLIVDISAPSRAPNELVLAIDGHKIAGWEDIEVTLRAEGFPNTFQASLSTPPDSSDPAITLAPGKECVVYLGDDQVISGYVDSLVNHGDAENHMLEIAGRGRTCDMVDCSAEWKGGQIQGSSALDVITKLAEPYSIVVEQPDGSPVGGPVIQFNLNYGETAADLAQRIARASGLMLYEGTRGDLILANSGATKAASAIVYGKNVLSWSAESSLTERYSDVVCVRMSQDLYGDVGEGGMEFYRATDKGVPRHRLIYIVMEQALKPSEFTIQLANWEQARRIGRSVAVHATIDSWRDKDDALWLPNTLVDVDVPGFRLTDKSLVIGEVTFRQNNNTGTTADLMLMPPQAFTPEPFALIQAAVQDIKGPEASQ